MRGLTYASQVCGRQRQITGYFQEWHWHRSPCTAILHKATTGSAAVTDRTADSRSLTFYISRWDRLRLMARGISGSTAGFWSNNGLCPRESAASLAACHPPVWVRTVARAAASDNRKHDYSQGGNGGIQVLPSTCRAMVGQIAGGGRTEKPLLKAGNAYHKFRVKRNSWPKVCLPAELCCMRHAVWPICSRQSGNPPTALPPMPHCSCPA